jgi:hypothetical protein
MALLAGEFSKITWPDVALFLEHDFGSMWIRKRIARQLRIYGGEEQTRPKAHSMFTEIIDFVRIHVKDMFTVDARFWNTC